MIFDRIGWIASLSFLLFSLPSSVAADSIGEYLIKGLMHERHLPSCKDGGIPPNSSVTVYVLGGRQDSLIMKIKTVGRMHAEGCVRMILFLHRPGITEFAPALGRNYTNDEWASAQLKKEGIDNSSIEFVSISPAILSTFAEASEVSALARSRGPKNLVLVSSPHHSERVWRSFSHFNTDKKLNLYLYCSDEKAGILELLRERTALLFYRCLVFPFDRLWRNP